MNSSGPVCFHLNVWPVGKVRGKKSSDFETLSGTHLGEDEDVKRVLLGFLIEFEMGLVFRVGGDDGGGVEGEEDEMGLDLFFIIEWDFGSDCIKAPFKIEIIINLMLWCKFMLIFSVNNI